MSTIRRSLAAERAHGTSRAVAWLSVGSAALASLLVARAAVAVDGLPAIAIAVAVGSVVVLLATVGMEGIIVLAALTAFGLVPFADPGDVVAANLPVWFVSTGVAIATMVFGWGFREATGRRRVEQAPSVLLAFLVVLFVYTLAVMVTSEPRELPSVAGPFMAFPAMALATWLWLSHEEALEGLRRAAPVAVVLVAAWALAYIGGSAGACGPCVEAVSSDSERSGLLGPASRLYTPGQNAFLALTVVSAAVAMWRFRPLWIGLTLLALSAVALQSSRAQYAALLAGLAVLVGWRLSRTGPGGRVLGAFGLIAAIALLASTPVGERAVSGYEDLSAGGGTAGYRLRILEDASENWTLLGQGVSRSMLNLGFDIDLGLSNTILVIGFVGGFLQIAVLLLGIVRGLRAGTLVGAAIAGILVVALTARPSLPLIEYGHSTGAYAAALGFAASLAIHSRRRARPVAAP